MDDIFESMFPQLVFTGAFLTSGLRAAFVIPLLQESKALGKDVGSGELYIQIENGYTYTANGTVSFGDDVFRVSMTVRSADADTIAMNELGDKIPADVQLPRGVRIPSIFEGVGREKYCLGVVNSCDRTETK